MFAHAPDLMLFSSISAWSSLRHCVLRRTSCRSLGCRIRVSTLGSFASVKISMLVVAIVFISVWVVPTACLAADAYATLIRSYPKAFDRVRVPAVNSQF
eukprot:6495375-Pyramimonas_sp.AAC.1